MELLYKPSSIMILRDDDKEDSVKELLNMGLAELADKYDIILVFPNPTDKGWNTNISSGMTNDIEFLQTINQSVRMGIIGEEWRVT